MAKALVNVFPLINNSPEDFTDLDDLDMDSTHSWEVRFGQLGHQIVYNGCPMKKVYPFSGHFC